MIAIAPDGTRIEFPEDATQEEIDAWLKDYEGGAAPEQPVQPEPEKSFTPVIPPESEWPRPGVGPWGPPHPEEILTIGPPGQLGMIRSGLEQVNQAASDIASAAIQSWGLPAAPGIPQVQIPSIPITAGAPVGVALRKFAPEYAQAADVWAGETVSSFTEPGMMLQLPFAAWKPVLGKFGLDIIASLPETIQAIAEAPTGPERLTAGLNLAASGAMLGGIGHQLGKPTVPRALTRREAINAAKERLIEANRQRQYPQAEGGGLPPEAGRGYRIEPAAGLEKEAPVLLESLRQMGFYEALADNPALSAFFELHKEFPATKWDRNQIRVASAGLAMRDANGNIIPGKIRISESALRKWWEQRDPATRAQALSRLLNEEMIHSFVLPEEAFHYFYTLSKTEQQAAMEFYKGGTEFQMTDIQVGHEALRQYIQRLMDLDPTEIIEARGVEKWNRYATELVGRIIQRIREWIGTESAQIGQQIKLDVINRLADKVDILTDVMDQTSGMPPELLPWAVNRSKAAINRDIIEKTGLISAREAIAALGDRPEYLMHAMKGILTERQKFMEGRNTVRDVAKKYLVTLMSIQAGAVNLDTFKAAFPKFDARPEFLAYERDGTAKVRPEDAAGWWFWTDEGQRALNNLDKGIMRRRDWQQIIDMRSLFGLVGSMERAFEPLDTGKTKYAGSRAKYNMTNLPEALAALKGLEKKVEPILQWADDFQGIAEFKKPFMGQFMGFGEFPTIDSAELTYWITGKGDIRDVTDPALVAIHDAWASSQLYGSKNQKMVSARINEQFRQLQELGLAKDLDPAVAGAILHHFLWDKVRGTTTTHQGLYKAIEAAAINRKKPVAPESTLFEMPEAGPVKPRLRAPPPERIPEGTAPLMTEVKTMGKEEFRTYQETQPPKKGFYPVTPVFVENFTRDYFGQTSSPNFKKFTREVRKRFGDVKPGALAEIWQEGVKERLLTASGEDLRGIAQSLGLTRKLAIESREGKMRNIADPPPEMPPEVPGPQIPGITRTEFMMASRAAFGPYKKGFKPTPPTPASQAQFTKAQRFRATVMAGIFESLMEETKGKERWRRETVTPDEVADPKIQTKQPIYQEFHPEQLKDRENLGRMLTSDARGYGGEKVRRVEQGQPVEFSRAGIPVSATKRLTAIMDYDSKKVYLVSTWRDGRRGVVLSDPKHPARESSTLDSMMNRYQIIGSVLIDEPVQKFIQEFKNGIEYEFEFGKPAYEASKRTERYEPPEGEKYEPPRARYELTEPVTPDEAISIIDHVFKEVGVFEGPEDVLLSIDALRAKPEGQVISAYSKLANQILEKNPTFTDQQVIEALAKQVYDNHIESATSKAYVERTISQGPPATGEALKPTTPTRAEAALEGERVPAAIEVEAGTPYRQFLESEYGKKFAGKELPAEPPPGSGGGAAQPTVSPVRTMVASQEPAAINRMVKGGTELFDKTVSEFFRWYSEWMNEALRRTGGEKAKLFADVVDKIIETERRRYGALTPWLDPARKEAGKLNQATLWAHKVTPVTERAAIANLVEAIEGKIPIPAFAKKLITLAQQANYKIGLMYQQANPKFIATGLFQRNLTGFGYDVIRQGSGDVWEAWVDGMAKANRIPVGTVKTFFQKWKRILDDPGVNDVMIERVNQDFQRQFPRAITHVKVDIAGVPAWQQVIHSDIFNYLETAARRASHSTAFRDFFPNTPNGRKMFTKMMKQIRDELPGPEQANLTALVRALQGHPTDNYARVAIFRPGEPAGELVKFVNQTLGNTFARLVLTGQMFVQPGENFAGAVPVFLGYRNYLEAIARLAKNDGFYRQLELQGSVNRVILDYSYDPHSPVRSFSKITGNVLSKVFMEQMLNELQEATAAATAHVVRERIAANKLSFWERNMLPRTFRAMGFDTPKIQKMMRGDKALLDQFEGKAAAFLTSGNKAIAEGSPIGSNRLFNSVFRFQSYPMMKANQLRKVLSGVGQAFQEGTNAEKAAAIYLLGRFAFGATVQGALTAGITALFYEGAHGVAIRKQEAKDETLQFLAETFLATMSGPMYLVYRGTLYKGVAGLGEQAMRTFFPYSIVTELWNFQAGTGQYKNMDLFDKIRKFVKMKIPGTKAISTGMSWAGLSMENKKLDAAINAFYRWRIDELGMGGAAPTLWEDESKPLRIQARKAFEALKRGDMEAYGEAINAAWELETKKGQLGQVLAAKSVLTNPKGGKLTDEEMQKLRNRIGDEYVDLIEDFDWLIKSAAGKLD